MTRLCRFVIDLVLIVIAAIPGHKLKVVYD